MGMAILLFALPQFLSNAYQTKIATETLLYMGLAVSWTLFSGFSGYVSFGHAAFFGLGAYVTGLATQRHDLGLVAALSLSFLLVGAFASAVGLLTLRLRGHYFAIATLGLAEAMKATVDWGHSYTLGTFGFALPIDIVNRAQETKYYVMATFLIVVVAVGIAILWSSYGLRLIAIREDEIAAEALGISPALTKISALGISGAFTGLFGGLFAWTQGFLTPEAVFAPRWSLELVVMSIVGGAGTLVGPLVGGLVFYLLPEVLIENKVILQRRDELYLMMVGIVLIIVMLFAKQGIFGTLQRSRFWPKGFRL
ncbi:MAG: branched-chain amino acid ABC transporter permease [Acidimicrobiaceae bacterium]|nr:branched-chain amino acid ABC transporter permease [Acidimicrobiaceae bacterium]